MANHIKEGGEDRPNGRITNQSYFGIQASISYFAYTVTHSIDDHHHPIHISTRVQVIRVDSERKGEWPGRICNVCYSGSFGYIMRSLRIKLRSLFLACSPPCPAQAISQPLSYLRGFIHKYLTNESIGGQASTRLSIHPVPSSGWWWTVVFVVNENCTMLNNTIIIII